MNLWGPLGKLHKSGSGFYLKLAQRFSGNAVVSQTWAAMAQDLDDQAAELQALSPAFWRHLERSEAGWREAVAAVEAAADFRTFEPADWSLHRCLERTLELEEQSSLRVYAPLIYHLRGQTGRALDFYVTVHAHLTRLAGLIQPFAGDPRLTRRCLELLERFEKEAQIPKAPLKTSPRDRARRGTLQRTRAVHAAEACPKRPAGRSHQRTEPRVGKIKLVRRRARH